MNSFYWVFYTLFKSISKAFFSWKVVNREKLIEDGPVLIVSNHQSFLDPPMLGISYEEKAFYDILVKVRDDHGFPYADEKCLILAKKIKELVDDKAQFADWSTRDDIKNQLNMDLTVLLYQNGYPPEWDEEVFEKVMEQAENFKKYSDQ